FTQDKVSSLEKDIKRYEETNKSLEAKYESRDKDYRSAEIERQKVTIDLKNANDKIALLGKDKDDLAASLKNSESLLAKTKESAAKSDEELRLAQKTLKEMEAQNAATVTNLQSQVATLKEQTDDLSKALKATVDEREKAKEEKGRNETALASAAKENNTLKEKNDQLLKDLSALQSKIKVREHELNEALKKEKESYQLVLNDLNTARESLRSAQWQVSELQTRNSTLDKSIASLQNQLKNQESDMQATIKQLRDINTTYQTRVEEAEGKINNYMKVEIDFRQKNSTLEKELAAEKVTRDEKVAEGIRQKETDYINRLREANERVQRMEQTLTEERSRFYGKLAEYATGSRLFEDAIEYYEKALVLTPKNAAIYYNMGIIYDENIDNPSKAIFCYSKYLELAPDAKDRDTVKKYIENCQKRLKGSKDGFK
ncbi:MAG: tetratricopeptide repeat protein, partial [Planctomycetota bacterium]